MATNPVPQRNHPSNAEEQENLEKPTLAHLAKQTHTGQILHVPDFLNVVDDKILGNQIIQALGNSGILRILPSLYFHLLPSLLSTITTGIRASEPMTNTRREYDEAARQIAEIQEQMQAVQAQLNGNQRINAETIGAFQTGF
nr:uncharacterized protein LOC109176731 [Ipomoea batatas]